MSRSEVIQVVNALGKEDRAFFATYLKAKELSEDFTYAEESSRRLTAMESGDRLNSSAIRDIHDSLAEKGM
jgi:fructose-1-phosphate kinase PfkB-like protein